MYIHRSRTAGADLSPLNCNFISLKELTFLHAPSGADSRTPPRGRRTFLAGPQLARLLSWPTGAGIPIWNRIIVRTPRRSAAARAAGAAAAATDRFPYLQSKSPACFAQGFQLGGSDNCAHGCVVVVPGRCATLALGKVNKPP